MILYRIDNITGQYEVPDYSFFAEPNITFELEENTIDSIEELNYYTVISAIQEKFQENVDEALKKLTIKQNEVIRTCKQLNKEIQELKEK